jgi:hypothetical protein
MLVQLFISSVSRFVNRVPGGNCERVVMFDFSTNILPSSVVYVFNSSVVRPTSALFVEKSVMPTSSPIISRLVEEF